MANPNYNPSSGGLATSRDDFQSHTIGVAFRHNAFQIDVNPPLNLDGYTYYTVADAIKAIAAVLNMGSFFNAGGDLSGTNTSQTVVGLQNHPVASTAPTVSSVPVYNVVLSRYDIRQLTLDDILPGFTINSFVGGSTVEIGATVNNPTFSASYSSTPMSANITNSALINSPFYLPSPYTGGVPNGTISGAFTEGTQASITFTLTAVGPQFSNKQATQSITFLPRSFGGVGTAGATSATASGTNAVLNGSAGTLASLGLFSTDVGQTFGPFSPSGQAIYLLLTGGSHTFTSNGFPFPFTVAPLSFTNQFGSVVSMYLYTSSTTLLTGTYSITVVS